MPASTRCPRTRLYRDADVGAVLVAAEDPAATWVQIEEARSSACEVVHGGRRDVIVDSPARHRRDDHRREELLGRTESKLIALEARGREDRLVDPAKSHAVLFHHDPPGPFHLVLRCRGALGRRGRPRRALRDHDVLTPAEAPTAQVVRYYRSLLHGEQRFKVTRDFLVLRPVRYFTEKASVATSCSVSSPR